jgi:hypothetical protein
MTDTLGWRKSFGVIAPSTNTAVQPEFDALRPADVTNHVSRIRIPNMDIRSDVDVKALMEVIRATSMAAVVSVVSADCDQLVMGMSAGISLGRARWQRRAAAPDRGARRREGRHGIGCVPGGAARTRPGDPVHRRHHALPAGR